MNQLFLLLLIIREKYTLKSLLHARRRSLPLQACLTIKPESNTAFFDHRQQEQPKTRVPREILGVCLQNNLVFHLPSHVHGDLSVSHAGLLCIPQESPIRVLFFLFVPIPKFISHFANIPYALYWQLRSRNTNTKSQRHYQTAKLLQPSQSQCHHKGNRRRIWSTL